MNSGLVQLQPTPFDGELQACALFRRRALVAKQEWRMMPNLLDQRLQFHHQRFVVRQVLRERVLGSDGFSDPVGADRSIVDAARDPVVVGPGLPEIGGHELERLVTRIHAREDAEAIHLRTRRRANPMEFADRKILSKAQPHLRRDDELSIRFWSEASFARNLL